ncbi:MAG: hypothetical protein OSA78_03050 [Flavobacteriales bacterium]|nr:hypothetical protein [Flavobacteriales bacterium]
MSHSFSVFLIALVALTTGCSEVTFQESVPLNRKSLNAFPKAWHGVWTDTEGDLHTISGSGFESSDSETEPVLLSPSVLLKRFQGYLVLNRQQDNGRWEVLLAKRKKDRILLFQFDSSNEASVAVWEAVLGASMEQASAPSVDVNRKTYVLSPENNFALRQLILKGGLTEISTLKRTAD